MDLADAQWTLKRGAEVDKLTGIERVEFSDYGIALDSEGNAGEAAKLLGVLIGADSLSDRGLVAAVLDYADTGLDLEAMLTIGLDLLLGESPSGVRRGQPSASGAYRSRGRPSLACRLRRQNRQRRNERCRASAACSRNRSQLS